jgi:hypothetical protein
MLTMGSSMGLGLAGSRLLRFGGSDHSRIGWHTAKRIKNWSLPPPCSFQKSWIEKPSNQTFESPTSPFGP